MRADSKPNPRLQQIIERYVVDNEMSPKDLTGAGAEKALAHANGQQRTLTGEPAFDASGLDAVRDVLLNSMSAIEDAGVMSAAMRDASSTANSPSGFGGSSSVGSPAYARLNLEPESNTKETLAQLTSGNGEHAVFKRLGDALERNMAATAGAHVSRRPPQLTDLVNNRTFAKGLVDLVASKNLGDLGDAMEALGEKAGPGLAKFLETLGSDPAVYEETQAPRPKTEPELTALRRVLELVVIDVPRLDIPIENVFRSEGGRAAFASFVKDVMDEAKVSPERRDQFGDEVSKATPLELKPMLLARVELGEALAHAAFKGGDVAAFTALVTSSERPRRDGALDAIEQLLQDNAPGAEDFATAALTAANNKDVTSSVKRLETALSL